MAYEILKEWLPFLIAWYLFGRVKTNMILMKPILTNTALYHLNLLLGFWIRIRPTARAIRTLEILIIRISWVDRIFLRVQFAEVASKL